MIGGRWPNVGPRSTSTRSRTPLPATASASAGSRVGREPLEASRTGLTHFRLRPAKRSPFNHRHREAEEVYVILSGDGRVKLGDEIRPVEALDAIRIAPEVPRAFEAGPNGLEFIAFGAHHEADGEPVEDDWVA
jgi:mannose-6-phosphate isomerase-like protein (cupin superfamily)